MANSRYNRLPFSPSYLFVATRQFILNGVDVPAGGDIDSSGMSIHRMRQLYDSRKIAVKLDDQGNPMLRIETAAAAELVDQAQLQPGEVVGHLDGAVEQDGTFVPLAEMGEEQLRKLAADMGIAGADAMASAELAAAIAGEPVIVEVEETETEQPETEQPQPEIEQPSAQQQKAPRYHAEHRGAGRWYVIDSNNGEPVTEPLKKDEALAKAVELNQ